MNLASRHLLIIVILGLVLSSAALSVHVATHTNGDTGSCQLCTSWSHAAPALAFATDHTISHPHRAPFETLRAVISPETRLVAFHQRGPPVAI